MNGDGFVSSGDAVAMLRSQLVAPTATMTRPDLCDVGGSPGCSPADSVLVGRALLGPPTAAIVAQCGPANP